MDLLNLIKCCSEEKLNSIVNSALKNAMATAENGKTLGFDENMSAVSKFKVHKGFIHPNTRIKYSNSTAYSYSMKTTDYIYDFAKYIKKLSINDRSSLVKYIENYINSYFGIVRDGIDRRDMYFTQMTFDTTTTDEELFEKIANLEIGDLKGKNVAMCTEKAAMAQNLLSLFGFEVYYCMGCVNNNGKEESHCFNIARAKDTYRLLDYSIPVTVFLNGNAVDYATEYMALSDREGMGWGVISTAMSSVSDLCVIQMQDLLDLGGEARMNFPGTMTSANWTWRARDGFTGNGLAQRLCRLTRLYGRLDNE